MGEAPGGGEVGGQPGGPTVSMGSPWGREHHTGWGGGGGFWGSKAMLILQGRLFVEREV